MDILTLLPSSFSNTKGDRGDPDYVGPHKHNGIVTCAMELVRSDFFFNFWGFGEEKGFFFNKKKQKLTEI